MELVESIAARSGCQILSSFSGRDCLLRLRCKCGQIFSRTPHVILRLKDQKILQCRNCRYKKQGDAQKLKTNYFAVIEAKQGKIIGPVPKKTKDSVRILCLTHDIEFKTRAYNVIIGHWGCPKCCGRYLRSHEEVAAEFKARGGCLVSKKITCSTEPLEAICGSGHNFMISLNKMESGRWCQKCSVGRSVGEKIARQFMEYVFETSFEKEKPKWLTFEGKRLELDGFSEKLKIAFEYDGDQHFRSNTVFSTKVPLQERQRLDRAKDKICLENGIKLFRFSEHKNGKLLAHQFQSQNDYLIKKDPTTFKACLKEAYCSVSKTMMERFNKSLLQVGWSYVSGDYAGVNSKLRIACPEGHQMDRNFYSVVGRKIFFCKECRKCKSKN